MDVMLLRWPVERSTRDRLRTAGVPRLLLLDGPIDPPEVVDCLEDWIRVPAAQADVQARVAALNLRSAEHSNQCPALDSHGVLRFAGTWVSLPPVQSRLTRALVDHFGAVVSRETLGRSGWPGGLPGRNALDVHVLRLRRRLSTVGLAIRTVRSRGYLLEAATALAAREA